MSESTAAVADGPDLLLDFDNDGVPNFYDRCPAETENGQGRIDGCADPTPNEKRTWDQMPEAPRSPRAELQGDAIVIHEKILFDFDGSAILAESKSVIEEVAAILRAHPELETVECAGHADARGTEQYNVALTQRRSRAVMAELIERKVAPERLVAAGYGTRCAIDSGNDDVAHAKNRRVEFVVLQRSGKPTGATSSGCDTNSPRPPSTHVTASDTTRPAPGKPTSPGPSRPFCTWDCICDRDRDGTACHRAATTISISNRPNFRIEYLEKACRYGEGAGCHDLALIEERKKTPDYKQVHALYTRALDLGDMRGARSLGSLYRYGEGVPADAARAIELYRMACAADIGSACALMGDMLAKKGNPPYELERAAELFIKACRLQTVDGCTGYEKLLNAGYRKDLVTRATFATRSAKADALYRQSLGLSTQRDQQLLDHTLATLIAAKPLPACDPRDAHACDVTCLAGQSDSCSRLAVLLAYGKGVPRDERRAQNLLHRACEDGSAEACNHLVNISPGAMTERPLNNRRRWCRGGDSLSCTNVAIDALGREDPVKLLKTSCERGEVMACAQSLLALPKTIRYDITEAERLIAPACRAGAGSICGAFAALLFGEMREGHPAKIEVSKQLASRYAALGCKSGATWACSLQPPRAR